MENDFSVKKRRLSDVAIDSFPIPEQSDAIQIENDDDLTDEQKSELLIKKLIEEDPQNYEQIPTGTYAELVAAQLEHDRLKRERIQKVTMEAKENLRRLQELSGLTDITN